MLEAATISVSNDTHAEEHSRRTYTPMSADRSLRQENVIIFDCGNDREHFNAFFRPSIEAYNARQKRSDRKKSLDYFTDLENGTAGYGSGKTQEKTVYHDVIQIGNRDTNGVTKRSFDVERWRQLKKDGKIDEASAYVRKHLNRAKEVQDFKAILVEIAQEIKENKDHKYDGILTHGLIIHGDEPNGTIHLDWRYTIYTDENAGRKRNGKTESYGVGRRVSMNKGLAKLGYKTTKTATALEKFRDAIKDRIEEKMVERGYQRDIKGEHRKHQPTAVYEMEQRAKEAEKKKENLEGEIRNLEMNVEDLQEELSTALNTIADAQSTASKIIRKAEAAAQKKIAEFETELQRREQEYREIIVLGRRAKAEQISDGIAMSETEQKTMLRRLPSI